MPFLKSVSGYIVRRLRIDPACEIGVVFVGNIPGRDPKKQLLSYLLPGYVKTYPATTRLFEFSRNTTWEET